MGESIYESQVRERLNKALAETYVKLKTGGELSDAEHLMVDRIDYCAFGNSCPFRIRIVNQFNDNYDYYYIKEQMHLGYMDSHLSTSCPRMP